MSSHILTIDTDNNCWVVFINPATGARSKKHTFLRAEFNGCATHRAKLLAFLDTIRVVEKVGREEYAQKLRKYLQHLKLKKGEEFAVGSNMAVSYEKLEVTFSI